MENVTVTALSEENVGEIEAEIVAAGGKIAGVSGAEIHATVEDIGPLLFRMRGHPRVEEIDHEEAPTPPDEKEGALENALADLAEEKRLHAATSAELRGALDLLAQFNKPAEPAETAPAEPTEKPADEHAGT